jgi:hypothetical protein
MNRTPVDAEASRYLFDRALSGTEKRYDCSTYLGYRSRGDGHLLDFVRLVGHPGHESFHFSRPFDSGTRIVALPSRQCLPLLATLLSLTACCSQVS